MAQHRALSQQAALAAAAAGERAVTRHAGQRLAVVPLSDLARLEQMDEDDLLASLGDAALEQHRARGDRAIPLSEVLTELGR
ncbi:MAG: hypothetical protein IT204_08615 [Fimbriimonadaceae bacterium]|nr:hypothetical protein [Fimbriimonadaceae bacterium]